MSWRQSAKTLKSSASTFVTPARAALQRQCACGQHSSGGEECESCKKKESELQRFGRTGAQSGGFAPAIVTEELRAAGRPLESGTRRFMESRFDRDFSDLRVHDSERAAASAESVNALAYTVGNHVVFNRGQYSPGTRAGDRLLAHELTHVAQQSSQRETAAASQDLRIGDPGDRHEKEAEAASEAVMSGGEAPMPGAAPPTLVQRQAAPGAAAKPAAPAPPPVPRDTHAAAPSTDVLEPTTHSTSNYGLGIFESELRSFPGAGAPCLLTLRVRINFDFQDAPPPAPVSRTLWGAAEQNSWINAFVRSVTARWNYRYALVPTDPKTCKWNKCSQAMARVEVIPVAQAGSPNATVNIYHVSASAYRSRAGFGTGYLTQEDTKRDGEKQITVDHEFGHLLGLDHSNPKCQSTDVQQFLGEPGDTSCYTGTPEQTQDMMGEGTVITPQDYRPFVQEMNYYTKCAWRTEGSAEKPGKQTGSHGWLVTGLISGGIGGAIIGGSLGSQPGGIGAGWGALAGGVVGGLALGGLGAIIDWLTD